MFWFLRIVTAVMTPLFSIDFDFIEEILKGLQAGELVTHNNVLCTGILQHSPSGGSSWPMPGSLAFRNMPATLPTCAQLEILLEVPGRFDTLALSATGM
jgi:hypothetical protein